MEAPTLALAVQTPEAASHMSASGRPLVGLVAREELDFGPGGLHNTRPSSSGTRLVASGTQIVASGTPIVPSRLIDGTLPVDATLPSPCRGRMIVNGTTVKTTMWTVVHGVLALWNQS